MSSLNAVAVEAQNQMSANRYKEELTHEEMEQFIDEQIKNRDELALLCSGDDYVGYVAAIAKTLELSAKLQVMDQYKLTVQIKYKQSMKYLRVLEQIIAIHYFYYRKLSSRGLPVQTVINHVRIYAYWHVYCHHHHQTISSSFSTTKMHISIGKGLPMVKKGLAPYHSFILGNIVFLPLSTKSNVAKLIAFLNKLRKWYACIFSLISLLC